MENNQIILQIFFERNMKENQNRISWSKQNMKLQQRYQNQSGDSSKLTYTAFVFNDTLRQNNIQMAEKKKVKIVNYNHLQQQYQAMNNIDQLLKVQSLKNDCVQFRNISNIFANQKLNSNYVYANKDSKRPVSAFIRSKITLKQPEYKLKPEYYEKISMNRGLSLSGKSIFQEQTTMKTLNHNDASANSALFRDSHLKSVNSLHQSSNGYIAKSRLVLNQQSKKSMHIINQSKERNSIRQNNPSNHSLQSMYRKIVSSYPIGKTKQPKNKKVSHQLIKKVKSPLTINYFSKNSEKIRYLTSSTANTESKGSIYLSNDENSMSNMKKSQEWVKKCGQIHQRKNKNVPITNQIIKSNHKKQQKMIKTTSQFKVLKQPCLFIEKVLINKSKSFKKGESYSIVKTDNSTKIYDLVTENYKRSQKQHHKSNIHE